MLGFNRTFSMLVYFLLIFASCYAVPTSFTRTTLVRRQNGTLDGPQTVTTTEQIPTQAGTFTQTCTILMTPIIGDNGESLVREETSCTISTGGGDPLSSTFATSTVSDSVVPTFTLTPSSAISNGVGPSSTALPPAVSVLGVSSVPNPVSTALSQNPPSTNSTGSSSPSPTSVTNSDTPASSPTPSPDASAVGAVADSSPSPSSTTFVPPGKKLQVLPIGLGVFAGISVIAIIVVGFVTYERTKHRKNFRRRKLAEAGTNMGYGGMAQP